MTEDHATLYDVFYAIGGGSEFMSQLGTQLTPALPTVTFVDLTVAATPIFIPPMPELLEPELIIAPIESIVPWYRRLWNLLNMDVRDIWGMLRKKRV